MLQGATNSKVAGGSPAAGNFLLLRQEKVTKEKATLLTVPFGDSLRCSHNRAAATQGDFLRGAQLAWWRFYYWGNGRAMPVMRQALAQLTQCSPTSPDCAVLLGGSEGDANRW